MQQVQYHVVLLMVHVEDLKITLVLEALEATLHMLETLELFHSLHVQFRMIIPGQITFLAIIILGVLIEVL